MSSLETRPAPPAGVAAMSLVRWTLVIFMALVAFASVLYAVGGLDRLGGRAVATTRTQYHCPMHPSVVQDHPGECPICSMTLVPLTGGPPATTPEAGEPSPPGLVPIELSPERVQLTGVRTAKVMREAAHGDVSAAGVVVESEHGQAQISARAAGWIQDLFVAETGRQVRKGQPLASIYSPDVLRAEQELVTARTWAGADTARLALDARKRLELLGVAAPELDELERTGQVQRAVVLRSPGNGTIVRKSAVVGTYVQPGVELFALADLSTVWVVAEVFEQAVSQVRVGQAARVTLAAFPGAPFEGRVQFVAPTVDATTRTCRVRVELRNPQGKLKPGMFGTVVLTAPAVETLMVPSEAIVDTGGLQYVYVAKDKGRFEPRVVKVGPRQDGRAQIVEGLTEGETVVTTANFFLDSESRMRAGIEGQPMKVVERIIEACARHRALVLLAVGCALVGALVAARRVQLDAVPDLSEPQVIVFTEWMGRSPTLVEDQVTYPIVTKLIATPHVADVRGYSMFGMSFVYVVFDEGTDVYWARSRVLEYLSGLRTRLPEGTTPTLGPDATGVGWVFQYALVDGSGRHGLDELRTFQDFSLKNALGSVPGVAEVASVGGYERQYQVVVDPERLRAHGVTLPEVSAAIQQSNNDVGGRILEMSGREYYVRGRGYIKSLHDVEGVVVRAAPPGGPALLVKDLGQVRFGPDLRRGLLEWNGDGEAVGGIVVMRTGENALDVIERVKKKIADLQPSFPAGVKLEIAYDRSGLILRAIDTLKHALLEEGLTVSLVIILFLLHARSSLLPILSIPIAVALSFIPMALFGVPSTIMSLGGIAIAIGATVDAEIVMIEAAHKKLEHAAPGADRRRLLAEAAREVTPAIFFSLLIVAVAFLPVFTLTGQAGRLFRPLAFTKTFVMLISALLSITFAPALRDLLIRGKIRSEAQHPVSRLLKRLYEPFVYIALRQPKSTLAIGLFALASAVPLATRLGHEFMPPLAEGDLLYMPITLPNVSIEEAKKQVQLQDRLLRQFPEVETVFGKVGRAETPTDPAPITMIETTVRLRPTDQWRRVPQARWYSRWAPAALRAALRPLWPDERPMSWDELTAEMNRRLQLPGWTNAWTMPIKTRTDMLSTGVRTPVGLKIFGRDLGEIEKVGTALEHVIAPIAGTRSVLYERNLGGLYLDIVPRPEAMARYGLRVADVESVIEGAIGGLPIGTTVEGRNRFSINVRYPQDQRASVEQLAQILVPLPAAAVVPLGEVADLHVTNGPPMVRDEAGLLVGYVYVDIDPSGRDLGGYVDEAKATVARAIAAGTLTLPPGAYLKWTGQYEQLEQMAARMKLVVPLTVLIVIGLLFFQFRNVFKVVIVLLSIPFALVGSVWLLWLLDYRVSTAVWVGVIALVGLAAQTGIVMIVYIDNAFERRRAAGQIRDLDDIITAHMEGTVQRVRPKVMTVATMLIGLVPLLWSTTAGADVMKRIAAPMVGGLLTSAFLTLELIPVIVTYWRLEELLWQRLAELAPSLLRSLRLAAVVIALGASLALALVVSRVYVAVPPTLFGGGQLVSAALFLGGITVYRLRRPAACQVVWPSSRHFGDAARSM